MVYKSCSGNPFRIHEEEDISIIMAFLSRVEQSLHDILSDTRELLCPPVSKWILTGRDVNKDIEIDGITQLSVFENWKIPHAKSAHWRALENIRNNVDLDKDFLYSDEDDGDGNIFTDNTLTKATLVEQNDEEVEVEEE